MYFKVSVVTFMPGSEPASWGLITQRFVARPLDAHCTSYSFTYLIKHLQITKLNVPVHSAEIVWYISSER